jgi:pimeloyl-ACP methyl ester carboxylesterase
MPSAHNLLDPARLKSFVVPEGKRATIYGHDVSYADYPDDTAPRSKPAILYFHGWGDGFEAGLPREYCLADAGFRIVMPNRPGYGGTSTALGTSAAACAEMARGLLDALGIDRVHVMGTSGGGPAALAFASAHRRRTKALVLQCAVTHPWSAADGKRYVPRLVQDDWDGASNEAFEAALASKFGAIGSEDALLNAIVGVRKPEVEADPAYREYMASLRPTLDAAHKAGKDSDIENVFLTVAGYFSGEMPPTLIIHDPQDPLVPFVHASYANVNIEQSSVLTTNGGHFMWLGSESVRLGKERIEFLKQHA